jgi:aldehyde:ferredoxin oxidoreductase
MHEPRLNKAMALGYMVNPHGADHCCNMIDMVYSGFNTKGALTAKNTVSLGMIDPVPFGEINPYRVALFRLIHLMRVIADSLVYCEVVPYSYEQLVELTCAVTGWNTTTTEQLRIAERIVTMYRLINVRQGLTESDDVLPARFFAPPRDGVLSDEAALDPEKMEKAKRYYYFLMGWDEEGVPTQEKLEELGLSDQKSW